MCTSSGRTKTHHICVYLVCLTVINYSILNGYIDEMSSVGLSSRAAYMTTTCYSSTGLDLQSKLLFFVQGQIASANHEYLNFHFKDGKNKNKLTLDE
jgi:hypothetical protein